MSDKFDTDARFASPQLARIVTHMHRANFPVVGERVRRVDELIESYATATGERPAPYCLTRMADYILLDDLTDVNKHKHPTEYPFHSGLQTARRDNHQTTLKDGWEVGR